MYFPKTLVLQKGVCMKKTYFAAIAVALAVLLAGCDGFLAPPEAAGEAPVIVGYTADGRAILELSLGSTESSARALHAMIAEAAADYYEVIFVENDTGDIYRTSWREGRVAKLRVPVGTDYDNSGDPDTGYAYLVAGRYSDKTLLGVGIIDDVLEGANPTSGTTITAGATRVNFEITALETDINPVATLPIASTSAPNTGDYNTFKPSTVTIPATFGAEPITIEEKIIPVFMIDDVNATEVTFGVRAGSAPPSGAIKVAGAATGSSSPFAWSEGQATLTKLQTVTVGTGAAGNPAFATDAVLTLPIGLTLTPNLNGPQADPGLCLVYFEIPVYLYDDDTATVGTAAETWYFRGGLNNRLLDIGHTAMGLGGAALVSVGDAFQGFGTGLEIGGNF